MKVNTLEEKGFLITIFITRRESEKKSVTKKIKDVSIILIKVSTQDLYSSNKEPSPQSFI
jgi:hypothetical protein